VVVVLAMTLPFSTATGLSNSSSINATTGPGAKIGPAPGMMKKVADR